LCNKTCLDFGRRQLKAEDIRGKDVMEVGAQDVNGSLRPYVQALGPRRYVGVDLAPGPGVDVVCDASTLAARLGPESCDVLISTEMLEHVREWCVVVANLKQVLRPGGLLLLTTRSKGFDYHAFPADFWRFEPDDLEEIFADFEILALERDAYEPGVFLKARKPAAWQAGKSQAMALYSIIIGRRTESVSNGAIMWFRLRYGLRRTLSRVLPQPVKRFLKRLRRRQGGG